MAAKADQTMDNTDTNNIKQRYQGKDMCECLALLQFNFQKEIDDIMADFIQAKEKMANLESCINILNMKQETVVYSATSCVLTTRGNRRKEKHHCPLQ